MYAAIHDLEPERFVSMLKVEGVQPGVGCHLRAAFIPNPVLGGGNKFGSDSSPPVCRRNIPALDVTDRTGRVATVRV